jgi:hypothetical protein
VVWNASEAVGNVVVTDVDFLMGVGGAKTPYPGENFGEGCRKVEIWFCGWGDPVIDSVRMVGGVKKWTGVFVGVIYIGYAKGRHMCVVAEQDEVVVEEGYETWRCVFDCRLPGFINVLK